MQNTHICLTIVCWMEQTRIHTWRSRPTSIFRGRLANHDGDDDVRPNSRRNDTTRRHSPFAYLFILLIVVGRLLRSYLNVVERIPRTHLLRILGVSKKSVYTIKYYKYTDAHGHHDLCVASSDCVCVQSEVSDATGCALQLQHVL